MIHIVQFSGGKDSTALVLWAREQWGDNFTPLFCDTKWEHPLTYEYIEQINQQVLGGRLVTVKSTEYPGGMVELVAAKGRVPSARGRFCTEALKVFPTRDYLRTLQDEYEVFQGVRGEESAARRAAGNKLWSDVYDCWVRRPLYHWTAVQVFDLHQKHGVEPNPLYKLGAARVGCFPCVMVSLGELRRITHSCPETWTRIAELEKAAGATFFPPHYIPSRFCERVSENGAGIPTAEEVRRYITKAEADQIRLWDRCGPGGCLSIYNLCE
jgi:3'-phosphoadenosine 5'-phosphosulfate sulfotransferase (PAPS reductase)/FAD synthetase